MRRRTSFLVSSIALAVGLTASTAFREVVPGHADRERRLPGDPDVAAGDLPATLVTDRVVTIDAAPAAVWPWVAQMGYQRAGWYSHDWLEAILGVASYRDGDRWGWRSSRTIVPDLQDVRARDRVPLGPGLDLVASVVDPGRLLLLTGDFGRGPASLRWAWAWELRTVGPDDAPSPTTRLHVRTTITTGPLLAPLVRTVVRAGHAEMERKQLVSIRARVEESA